MTYKFTGREAVTIAPVAANGQPSYATITVTLAELKAYLLDGVEMADQVPPAVTAADVAEEMATDKDVVAAIASAVQAQIASPPTVDDVAQAVLAKLASGVGSKAKS